MFEHNKLSTSSRWAQGMAWFQRKIISPLAQAVLYDGKMVSCLHPEDRGLKETNKVPTSVVGKALVRQSETD